MHNCAYCVYLTIIHVVYECGFKLKNDMHCIDWYHFSAKNNGFKLKNDMHCIDWYQFSAKNNE